MSKLSHSNPDLDNVLGQHTAQHTPGRLDICISNNSNLVHIEHETYHSPIATLTGGHKDERIANALRLVHCWNCHDELLVALYELKSAILRNVNGMPDWLSRAIDNADEAAAKARSQS